MAELNIDAAVEAVVAAIDKPEYGYPVTKGYVRDSEVRLVIEAALPVLTKAIREQVAAEIDAGTPEAHPVPVT